MCFMIIQSAVWIRAKAYEFFLVLHIIFAIVVIVSLF